jgi:hypothetical protein
VVVNERFDLSVHLLQSPDLRGLLPERKPGFSQILAARRQLDAWAKPRRSGANAMKSDEMSINLAKDTRSPGPTVGQGKESGEGPVVLTKPLPDATIAVTYGQELEKEG